MTQIIPANSIFRMIATTLHGRSSRSDWYTSSLMGGCGSNRDANQCFSGVWGILLNGGLCAGIKKGASPPPLEILGELRGAGNQLTWMSIDLGFRTSAFGSSTVNTPSLLSA
jgi:hypothetical protein